MTFCIDINRLEYSLARNNIFMPKPKHDGDWFSAARAARLSHLSKSMLNYLCREGIVEPTCACPRGHGVSRHYSFGDVVALRLVKRLSMAGVSPLRLRDSLSKVRKLHPEITLRSLPGTHVATDGTDIYLCRPGQPLERAFDGQFVFAFVVELAHIRKEVIENMAQKGGIKRKHLAAG